MMSVFHHPSVKSRMPMIKPTAAPMVLPGILPDPFGYLIEKVHAYTFTRSRYSPVSVLIFI